MVALSLKWRHALNKFDIATHIFMYCLVSIS